MTHIHPAVAEVLAQRARQSAVTLNPGGGLVLGHHLDQVSLLDIPRGAQTPDRRIVTPDNTGATRVIIAATLRHQLTLFRDYHRGIPTTTEEAVDHD